jgi:hypothetical protein
MRCIADQKKAELVFEGVPEHWRKLWSNAGGFATGERDGLSIQ